MNDGAGRLMLKEDAQDKKVMVRQGSDSKSLFEDWRYKTWDYEISPDVLMVLFTRWDEKNPGSERHCFEINHKGSVKLTAERKNPFHSAGPSSGFEVLTFHLGI
jgi:hypothetical protein